MANPQNIARSVRRQSQSDTLQGNDISEIAFQKAVGAVAAAVMKQELAKASSSRPRGPDGRFVTNVVSPSLAQQITNNLAYSFERPPEEVEAALAAQGMTWSAPLGPGRPLNPYFGYRSIPRARDYPIGENSQITPRFDRISFATLSSIIKSYYAAQIAIRHLINDVRSLDYQFVPPMNISEDATDDLEAAEDFMRFPDRRQPFRAWLAEYLQDVLRYDAGTLYIRRNALGRPIALEVVSGTTIVPLTDFFGRTPVDAVDDATRTKIAELGGQWRGDVVPAYVQVLQGMPASWLAFDDLLYQPLNPLPESEYGLAPMESVLLQANTDIRFQWHFLQFFTEGTIPAGFMEAPPDLSSPTQIEDWQRVWDAVMMGDQAKLNQIRWVPAGANFKPVKDNKFDSSFSLYLMRCTAAAFGVTPNDLGFTEDVNRSTGEIQVDVQFRVGTLPIVRHVEDLINGFLQEHLGLKARIQFDTGQGTSHRLETAQANKLYVEMGSLSADEVRRALGKRVSKKRPTPRFINNTRSGPIPLIALETIAGDIDATTFGPSKSQKLIRYPFATAPGVAPPKGSPAAQQAQSAEQELYAKLSGVSPQASAPVASQSSSSAQPTTKLPQTPSSRLGSRAVASKEGATGGISVATGATGVDTGENDPQARAKEVYRSLRQWRENSLKRTKKGLLPRKFDDLPPYVVEHVWKNLEHARTPAEVATVFAGDLFGDVVPKASARKGLDRVAAGIIVQAEDTGRVLMVQRTPDKHDPHEAYARWEFPGGRLDGGPNATAPDPSVWDGAKREWQEETGATLPNDVQPVAGWVSETDKYEGFLVRIPREADVKLDPQPSEVSNAKWWNPDDLEDPVIRGKVTESLNLIGPLLKSQWANFHQHTDEIVNHYAPLVNEAMEKILTPATVRKAMRTAWSQVHKAAPPPKQPVAVATGVVPPALAAGTIGIGAAGIASGGAALAGATIAGAALAVLLASKRNLRPLREVIQRLYADAVIAGSAEAAQATHGVLLPEVAEVQLPHDYYTAWPTAPTRTLLANPPRVLADLLLQLELVVQEIADTQSKRIAQAIQAAFDAQESTEELEQALRAILDDVGRGLMIAETEFSRAFIDALRATYKANYVTKISWLHQPGACARCMENASVSPISISDQWPSGNAPVHPLCRCVEAPVATVPVGSLLPKEA